MSGNPITLYISDTHWYLKIRSANSCAPVILEHPRQKKPAAIKSSNPLRRNSLNASMNILHSALQPLPALLLAIAALLCRQRLGYR